MDTNYREIFIVLSQSGTNFAKAIKKYTREPYAHVSIAFDENLEEMYSFGRIRPSNPFLGGFVDENVYEGTYAEFAKTACVYKLEISEKQFFKLRNHIEKFKKNRDKYSYNIAGIIAAMIRIYVHRENKYFCSQFVAYVLEKSGIKIIDKRYLSARPSDFRKALEQKVADDKIFEGSVKEFREYKLSKNFNYMVYKQKMI